MALTPEEQIDDGKIRVQGIHTRRRRSLRRMRRMHGEKIPRVRREANRMNDTDGFRGRVHEIRFGDPDNPLTRPEAVAIANEEKQFYQDKLDKIIEFRRLMVVEEGFRDDAKVDRTDDLVGDDEGDD